MFCRWQLHWWIIARAEGKTAANAAELSAVETRDDVSSVYWTLFTSLTVFHICADIALIIYCPMYQPTSQRLCFTANSLTHCCTWPAEGRSNLHNEWSRVANWQALMARPISSSTCLSQVLRGLVGASSQWQEVCQWRHHWTDVNVMLVKQVYHNPWIIIGRYGQKVSGIDRRSLQTVVVIRENKCPVWNEIH